MNILFYKSYFLLIFVLLLSNTIIGQEFSSTLTGTDFSICGGKQTLTITLNNDGLETLNQDSVYVSFTNAANFYFDNLTQISGPDVAVADPDTVVFWTPTGVIAPGETLSFSIEIVALCGAELTEDPAVNVYFTSAQFVSETIEFSGFQVAFADLSIISTGIEGNLRPNLNLFDAIIGVPDTIKVPVTNAGQGTIDSIIY